MFVDDCVDVMLYILELVWEFDYFFIFNVEYLVLFVFEVEGNLVLYIMFDKIWGLYEIFCGVYKYKKVGLYFLKRCLYEIYGLIIRDNVYVFIEV